MNWWHYLLLVNIYLTLFYGFYALLLRRETFFQLNRVYLVGAALLSFFIPLIQSQWVQGLFITKQVQFAVYNSGAVTIAAYAPIKDAPYTMGELFTILYITGAAVLTVKLAWQLILLNKVINKPAPSAAYSFFKKIKLGNDVADRDVIMKHEQVHAQQWHSADVLIIEAVMIVNWFNPIVYLYRFAIKHIHEFIADRQALATGANKADYALLLLSQTFEAPAHRLVNPFYNHSLLKQRIMMLQKNKSQRIKLAKYGLSAPLFILMLVLSSATINNSKAITTINYKAGQIFQKPVTDMSLNEVTVTSITKHATAKPAKPNNADITMLKSEDQQTATANKDTVPVVKSKVYTAVQNLPSFPGGQSAFSEYLSKAVKYPKAARENNIQGRVIATFIVEKNGSLSNISIVRSVSPDIDKEALRILAASPKWIPGKQNGSPVRTQYSVPINFSLVADGPDEKLGDAQQQNNSQVFMAVEQQPTFPGGQIAFEKYIAKNIKYPTKARESKTEGRVIITFVVEKDGSLSDFKVVRGLGNGTDEEALRVLQQSPNWKPGVQNGRLVRVQYTIPINFSLTGKPADTRMGSIPAESESAVDKIAIAPSKEITLMVGSDGSNYTHKPTTPDALVIIDGKERTYAALKSIDPQSIKSVSILKDASAKALYGTKGNNGVILVTTKAAKL
ncbi:TonB family protein [Inquilinus sp. KBS0705]|nr:TonB family protein [Inquilinus sp. KBS0705]